MTLYPKIYTNKESPTPPDPSPEPDAVPEPEPQVTSKTENDLEMQANQANAPTTEDIAATPPSPATHKLPLEINGVTYVFEYIVTSDTSERNDIARQLAASFCGMHGEQLVDKDRLARIMQSRESQADQNNALSEREVLEEHLRTDCEEPISGALVANMKYPSDL